MDQIEAARHTAWQSTLDRASWSYEEFCLSTKDWDVVPVRGGAVLVKGCEIHACIFPNSLSKRALLVLAKVLKEHGQAITTTHIENLVGESFVIKLGFKRTFVTSNVQYWRMTNGN